MSFETTRISLSVTEVQELLGVSRYQVYKLVWSRQLPIFREDSGKIWISTCGLKRWLENGGFDQYEQDA